MSSISGFFLRKFFTSPRKEWVKADSLFMLIGIVISVATLTVAIAIFQGYETTLKEVILGVNAHIYIFRSGENDLKTEDRDELVQFLRDQPEVQCYSTLVMSQAMMSRNKKVKGCVIRGIEWDKDDLPTRYRENVFQGKYELENDNDIVLGYRLARVLNAEIGDSIKISVPTDSEVTLLGLRSKENEFRIVGLYKSGMYEYDDQFAFVDLNSAQNLFGLPGDFTMLEVKLKIPDIDRADYLSYKWDKELNYEWYRYQVNSWIDFNGNLFTLLELEKWVVFIILSFLVLIASFNVISNVTASILERKQELGILQAFGTSRKMIRKIFLFKSVVLSGIGVISGLILGYLIGMLLQEQTFFLLKADVYFLEKIYVEFDIINILLIVIVSMLIVFITSLIPLKRISELQITEILRDQV
jgi:lipoprotein-releasing system permease protein